MRARVVLGVIGIALVVIGATATAPAEVPRLINYQGVLREPGGSPVPDTAHVITFRLYSTAEGGTPLWEETQMVPVQDGLFNVILGKINSLNLLLFDRAYWLGMEVAEAGGELEPRTELTSSPYAFTAKTGGGWTHEGTAACLATGVDRVGIGTTSPSGELGVVGQIALEAMGPSSAALDFRDTDGSKWQVQYHDGGLSFWEAGVGPRMLIHDGGNIGIGTTSPSRELEVNGIVEANGFTVDGTLLGTSSDSYWSQSGGGISFNSGNVGIGTGNPLYLLDLQRAGSGGGPPTPAPAARAKGYKNDSRPGAYLLLGKSRGSSIGQDWMTFPGDTLGIVDGFGISSQSTEGVAARMVFLQVGEGPDTLVPGAILLSTCDGDSGIFERMRVNASGNVGIGDTLPDGKLEVNPDATEDSGDEFVVTSNGSVGIRDRFPDGSFEVNPDGMEDTDDEFVVKSNGSVGIGVRLPSEKLEVDGDIQVNNIRMGHGVISDPEGLHLIIDDDNTAASEFFSVRKYGKEVASSTELFRIQEDGSVGVGTTIPNEKVTVDGALSLDELSTPPSATSGYGKLYVRSTDSRLYFKDDGGAEHDLTAEIDAIEDCSECDDRFVNEADLDHLDAADGAPANAVSVDNDGNVGIGTSEPSPSAKLHVDGAAVHIGDYDNGGWLNLRTIDGTNDVDISNEKTGGDLYIGEDHYWDHDVIIMQSKGADPDLATYFKHDGNVGIMTPTPQNELDVRGSMAVGFTYPGTVQAPQWGMIVEGKVGIGTTSPNASLEVQQGLHGTAAIFAGEVETQGNSLRVKNYAGLHMITTHGGGSGDADVVVNEDAADIDFRVESATSAHALFVQASDGHVGIGTATPGKDLDVVGTTRTKVLQITGGADITEPFAMSAKTQLTPGTVVVIDESNPGNLKTSDRAYDRRVAGVISGAGGLNPGLTLNQPGVSEDGQNVALAGRVYCWADATTGPIGPGDLLTTSSTPGHAMKVSDYVKAQGAVIGKAMSSLRQGQGLILVLVQPQ